MKKFLLLLPFSLCVLFLASCSNDEVIVESNEISVENLSTLSTDSTIIRLSCFNDSLIANASQSRGFKDFFKKVFSVAFADIKGAVQGYKVGSLFGPTGGWIGAAVVGVGSSACEGFNQFSRAQLYIEQSDIELAYSITISDPLFETNKELIGERVNLRIPTDFMEMDELGKVHNLTLYTLKNKDLQLADVSNCFTPEELTIIHSNEFTEFYSNHISSPNSYSLDYALTNPDDKADYIIKLFLDLYSTYPSDSNDVEYIINEYIKIIEADKNITTEEKKVVYAALSMAGYSSDFWEEQLNVVEN